MIYRRPEDHESVDEVDIVENCPLLFVTGFDLATTQPPTVDYALARVVVVTQTCDLAQGKVTQVVVAPAYDAEHVVAERKLKASDIKGPVRAGRVFGWYFLPANDDFGLPEIIVDLRQLYTVPLDLLEELCRRGERLARIQPLFRGHLGKHLAETYSRIGLPEPYETQ